MIESVQRVTARILAIEQKLAHLRGTRFEEALLAASAGREAIRAASAAIPTCVLGGEAVERVRDYMDSRGFNPALAAESKTFVEAAETYGMDWRLAPALATVESSGGRECFRPYNPFGIMGRDFASFRQAIYEVNRLVRSYGYGNDLHAILSKYNPSGGEAYIQKVLREMAAM